MSDPAKSDFPRLATEADRVRIAEQRGPVDGGGGSGNDGGMEARLSALEKSMIRVETRMESLASKSDVSEAKFQIIIWVVSAIILAQVLPALLRFFSPG